VIRGETHHFEIVANESASGLMQVQLDSGIPVANGILTTDTEEQRRRARAKRPGLRRGRGGNGEPRQEHREKPQMKSARRRSRELALQGLYAWQLAGDNARSCNPSSRSQRLRKADAKYFARLCRHKSRTPRRSSA